MDLWSIVLLNYSKGTTRAEKKRQKQECIGSSYLVCCAVYPVGMETLRLSTNCQAPGLDFSAWAITPAIMAGSIFSRTNVQGVQGKLGM